MTNETVVHVTTLEQWKSVLDVWFSQGHYWFGECLPDYGENRYKYTGSRQLALNDNGTGVITCFGNNHYSGNNLIEYADFMAQQEKTMAKETYYTTQEQFDRIEYIKNFPRELRNVKTEDFSDKQYAVIFRYIGGDDTIEFKVKEQLYRLWRIDDAGDKVYMMLNSFGTPDWTANLDGAFTAPREEIEKHKTVSWEIEEAD